MNTGHLLLALDIAAFGDPDQVRRKVEELQQEVRASHPAAEVMAPGDLESSRLRAAAHSVELAPSTVAQLRELAAVRGAQRSEERRVGKRVVYTGEGRAVEEEE